MTPSQRSRLAAELPLAQKYSPPFLLFRISFFFIFSLFQNRALSTHTCHLAARSHLCRLLLQALGKHLITRLFAVYKIRLDCTWHNQLLAVAI
jgi:hypothetical protein